MEIKIPMIETVDVNSLTVDGKNPNKMSKAQEEALDKNIKKYGFLIPIVTNEDLLIADGEHRWNRAKALNMAEVPVLRLPVGEVDRRVLRQVLNKLKGTHDYALDEDEYKFIVQESNFKEFQELIGESDKKLVQFMASVEKEGLGKDIIPDVEKPKYDVKLGDEWELGEHRLVCGDCTDKQYVIQLMFDEQADMVFTDPPYGLGGYAGRSGKFEKMKGDNEDVIKFYNCIPDTKEMYLWGNWEVLRKLEKEPRDVIIWRKNFFGMGSGYRGQYELCFYYGEFKGSDSDVWDISKDNASDYLHPTQKPVELAERAIKNSSKSGEIVLDLFGGSGSTLIACEKLNRKCCMMEIDPKYCSVIIERWENLTGKTAKRVTQNSTNGAGEE